jgi:hypothetical protein
MSFKCDGKKIVVRLGRNLANVFKQMVPLVASFLTFPGACEPELQTRLSLSRSPFPGPFSLLQMMKEISVMFFIW